MTCGTPLVSNQKSASFVEIPGRANIRFEKSCAIFLGTFIERHCPLTRKTITRSTAAEKDIVNEDYVAIFGQDYFKTNS